MPPLTIGINHVTVSTADLDRMVTFYDTVFEAAKVFEGPAADGYPRMAIVELGSTRYVKVVEDGGAPSVPGTERFGVAVDSRAELRTLRERMLAAGAEPGEIVRLPTQWVMTVRDPDGALVQVCAHAQPGD